REAGQAERKAPGAPAGAGAEGRRHAADHVPAEIVIATPGATIATASAGGGRRAANASRTRGGVVAAAPAARPRRMPPIRSADARNDAALTAKKALTGRTVRSAAASAQPPIESALAVAFTSAFACWTFSRSTRAGRSAP